MSNYQDWIPGEPIEPGWYMAAVRTNDPIEHYYVLQLWFNPESTHKWFTGGGYVSPRCEPYHLARNVRFYMTMPTGPEPVESKEAMEPDTITGLARAQVRQICYRCSVGDPVWPPDSQHSEFSHGTDMHGDTTIGPEPCEGDQIHKLMVACFGDYYDPNEE